MGQLFWVLLFLDFVGCWLAAGLTWVLDWQAGWFFALAGMGAIFLVVVYNPKRLTIAQLEAENAKLRKQSSDLADRIIELTDEAIDENGVCRRCGSRHSALKNYPFDYNLHHRGCDVPKLRMQVEPVQPCPAHLLGAADI